ncbi:MAG: hypothetical protein JWP01_4301 [Myxococcales bacterium]|nr:hypothetical protein [Myxococcales bacterium]
MSGRVLVIDGDQSHDVFEMLGIEDGIARVRSPLLFEIGEELAVRIEQDGGVTEHTVRVRAHLGPADAQVTELELLDP